MCAVCSGTPSGPQRTKPASAPASTNAPPRVWQTTLTFTPAICDATAASLRSSRCRTMPGYAATTLRRTSSATEIAGKLMGLPRLSCRANAYQRTESATAPRNASAASQVSMAWWVSALGVDLREDVASVRDGLVAPALAVVRQPVRHVDMADLARRGHDGDR